MPFGAFPHTPGVFGAKAAVLNQRFSVGLSSDGSPTTSGRWLGNPVSDRLPVVDGVSGAPLRDWNTRPTCQSVVSAWTNPSPTPGLCRIPDAFRMYGRSASHGPQFVLRSVGSG